MNVLYTIAENRAYAIDKLPSPTEAAQLWARDGEGVTDLGQAHLTHSQGRLVHTFIPVEQCDGIVRAREAVRSLTERDECRVGWTYPALARNVLEWLDIKQDRVENPQQYIPHWHYQFCEPCTADYAVMWDMKSAYWQIASRATSPKLSMENGRVRYYLLRQKEEEKWEKIKTIMDAYKRLRLTLIGVNSVGCSSATMNCKVVRTWCKGVPAPRKSLPSTWLQPLAVLTIRAAYELTQEQRNELKSPYANADCVMCFDDNPPRLWSDLGIVSRPIVRADCMACGPADVSAVGAWKCGGVETEPHKILPASACIPFSRKGRVLPIYYPQVYR